jgi:asparagine synthase (glutamine-hydrolysing)
LIDELYEHQSVTAHHFHPAERRRLLLPQFRGLVHDVDPERRALLETDMPIVSRLQYLDLMQYLPYDILTKVDVAAMANSLEVRVPLLDHHVVELAATMPTELKLKPIAGGFEKKFMLKELAKRRYPAALIDRPKMGFGVPIGDWMATTLKSEIESRLLKSDRLPRFFEMSTIAGIWRDHLEQRNGTAKLWNLLFLDEWLKSHQEAIPA